MTAFLVMGLSLLLSFASIPNQDVPLTVKSLEGALAANSAGADAETLAQQVRAFMGPEIANLAKLPGPKIDELAVAWAIEVPGAAAPPKVVPENGRPPITLNRIGSTNIYAVVKHLNWGEAFKWHYEIGDRMAVAGNGQLEVY